MSQKAIISYNGTLTNAGGNSDLAELTPADDKPIKLRKLVLSQSTEVGDAQEESLRITVRRLGATVTSGSGGGTLNIELYDSAAGAISFTGEANNTTPATTSGADDILADLNWNIRQSPWEFVWEDEDWAPTARGGEVLVIRSEGTPTDDITFSLTANVQEM